MVEEKLQVSDEKPIHIGRIVRKKAKEKGLNATTLAPLIAVTPAAVSMLFKKEFIHARLLHRLCAALGYDFFSHYCRCPKNNMAEDAALKDSAQKISLLEKELEQLKTENFYLKEIVRLKGK